MIVNLTMRNIRIFFRDPSAIFFSLLASIILFVLYTAFLSTLQVDNMAEQVPTAESSDIDGFVNSWVLANIAMITTMTTSLSALAVFVNDRATNSFRDFLVSPASRFDMISGYLLGAFVISTGLSLVVLSFCQVYLGVVDDAWLSAVNFVRAFGYMVGFCLLFSSIWSFVVTFVRSHVVFMSLGTIIGTAGGFLAAAYVTVGQLPSAVVTFMNVLPINQAATLMRVPFTERTVEAVSDGNEDVIEAIYEEYGMYPFVAQTEVSEPTIWLLFAGLTALFLLGTSRIGRRMG